MRLYCDGFFDLVTSKDLSQLEALTSNGQDVELIVGVVEDKKHRGYTHDPSWALEQRTSFLHCLKCVHSVVSPSPEVLTKEFLQEHGIDAVYHAHYGASAEEIAGEKKYKESEAFADPIALGIYHSIELGPRTHSVPNGVLAEGKMSGWDRVWETKGKTQDQVNTRLLTG